MKLTFCKLVLTCRRAVEEIPFDKFTYFYGEMGAGKSTIARLVDYCLGSKELVMTPALQSEFVSVALEVQVDKTELTLERGRGSNQIRAAWDDQQIMIPARDPNGPVLPDTEVEVLSDLIFYLHGQIPPRVRKSQLNEDSNLERLTLRDLLWYCYLDQDSMDSSFFHLDRGADDFKRLKSRNVLRSILGIHQERVAELEQQLERVRRERLGLSESAEVLNESLKEAKFSSLLEIRMREEVVATRLEDLEAQIDAIRSEKATLINHTSDKLRSQAREAALEIEALERAIQELSETNTNDRRHLNEILALSSKVRRLESARAVLNDVDFETCPRCTQQLPPRDSGQCGVCGQELTSTTSSGDEGEETQADIASRVKEIHEIMEAQSTQMRQLRIRRDEMAQVKQSIDRDLVDAMRRYDSAYLSEAISLEREKAELTQELRYLQKISVLPERVQDLRSRADQLAAKESEIRRLLKEARAAAEQDLTNLEKLKKLFLDCLLRSQLSGFETDDIVHMNPPWFLPEVVGGSGELATTSFSTLGSGGKKNLFKCCFALAIHRLSTQLDTLLPTVLMIDSPMKNISERENRDQFVGFHQLLYELSTNELKDTQFVLIDKEFCPPSGDLEISVNSRHMRVDSEEEPPLIRYYRGK